MKHLKNIVATLILVLMAATIASANEPNANPDVKTTHFYVADLDDGIVNHNSNAFNAFGAQTTFLLSTQAVPAIQKTLASSNSFSDNFFVRPYTRKEFRIVRFLDNSFQIGLTKLIIAI